MLDCTLRIQVCPANWNTPRENPTLGMGLKPETSYSLGMGLFFLGVIQLKYTPWKIQKRNLQPSPMKRTENDLNQISMRTCEKPLIFEECMSLDPPKKTIRPEVKRAILNTFRICAFVDGWYVCGSSFHGFHCLARLEI